MYVLIIDLCIKNYLNIFYWVVGIVYVEWDIGFCFLYSIGCGGLYNVVVCDEFRILL